MMLRLRHRPARRLPVGFTLEAALFTLEADLAGNGQNLLRLAAIRKLALEAGHTLRAAQLEAQMLALVPR